jgi:hypothetical protein
MHVYPFNIKCAGCLKGVFLLLSVTASLNGMAQHGDKLPDSVNAAEEVSPPIADTSLTPKDTFKLSSPATSSDTPSVNNALPDTVVLRSVPDTSLSQYKKDKTFEYANDPAYWKTDSLIREQIPDHSPETGMQWRLSVRVLVFLVLVGALLMLLYWRFFYKASLKTAGTKSERRAGIGEEGFDDRIQEALRAKDYRMGTRYLFLKTLHMLDQRRLIRYQAKATNREYVLQMSTHRAAARFRFLADAYDHVWYGDFLLSEQQFGRLLGYFEDFYGTLSREN